MIDTDRQFFGKQIKPLVSSSHHPFPLPVGEANYSKGPSAFPSRERYNTSARRLYIGGFVLGGLRQEVL